jgi:hypothetical protein
MHRKKLADIRHKLSIIYKHIQSMHNELRYQAKTHTISENLSKKKEKKFCIFTPNFFFFLMLKKIKKKNNKDMLMENEIISSLGM